MPTATNNGHVKPTGKIDPMQPPDFEHDPEPIVQQLKEIPELSLDMIPAPLRDWQSDIAERMSCPLEYPIAVTWVALSSLIGRRCGVRPKERDDWTVIPNLWGAIVGPPGVQKTPATDAATMPLRRLVKEAIELHKAQAQEIFKLEMINQAEAEAAKAKMRNLAKGAHSREEMEELAEQAVGAAEDQPAVLKRYIVNDATVEALGERLKENPDGLMVFRDELTGFLRSLDKQGHESDRGFYLEAWNGTAENFIYDRIGRGVVILPAVCLSLFGTIQPGPLAQYLRNAGTGLSADGFVPRFQILLYPDLKPWKHVDRYAITSAKNRAFGIFKALDDFDPIAHGAQANEDSKVPFFHFSGAAQEYFNHWWTQLETTKLRSHETALMESHLAKYRSLMPSLSLIFHLIDLTDESTPIGNGPITLAATQRAGAWCDLLEAHARRVYQMAFESDVEPAQRLAERLAQSLPNPFTPRQVAQKGWTGLASVEEVERAVSLLEGHGWLQSVEVSPKGGGRTSTLVWVNPGIANL